MYHWVVGHPLFGDQVLRFRKGEGMPKKAKYLSILTMWTFIMFAVFIGLPDSAAWIKYFIALSGATGTLYIISQPNLKKGKTQQHYSYLCWRFQDVKKPQNIQMN